MALVVAVTDDDGVTISCFAVAVSSWRSVSAGVRRVNLQDLTHESATHTESCVCVI